MKIKTLTIELREITAEEGKILTNGEIFSEPGGSIFLSSNDDISNYYEITEEDYQNILKEEESNNE